MTAIVTRRHRLKFYLSVIFITVLYVAMGTILLIRYFEASKKGALPPKMSFMPIVSIVLYFMAGYTVFKYFRNAPIIRVDKEKISFNDKVFYWTELDSIALTGKQSFNYLLNF